MLKLTIVKALKNIRICDKKKQEGNKRSQQDHCRKRQEAIRNCDSAFQIATEQDIKCKEAEYNLNKIKSQIEEMKKDPNSKNNSSRNLKMNSFLR